MKVFISHKKDDSLIAVKIQTSLKEHGVDAYLDVLEGDLLLKGEQLTQHIKNNLNNCTDLLAVLSSVTQQSWWVPFEIGMASQNDFPIVSYLSTVLDIPDYLSYWPKLKRLEDLSQYVASRKQVEHEILIEKSLNTAKFATKKSQTERFYNILRSKL